MKETKVKILLVGTQAIIRVKDEQSFCLTGWFDNKHDGTVTLCVGCCMLEFENKKIKRIICCPSDDPSYEKIETEVPLVFVDEMAQKPSTMNFTNRASKEQVRVYFDREGRPYLVKVHPGRNIKKYLS